MEAVIERKILVIEDEFKVRANVKLLLEEEGYKVFCAATGEEGISLALEILPDLIICDIMMPGMDGYEVLKELSENRNVTPIPFIYLTAKVEKDDLRTGMQLGADDYIFKPFKADDLLKSVSTRLKKYQLIKEELLKEQNSGEEGGKDDIRLTENERLFLVINGAPQFIKINEIRFIRAEDQYTNVSLINGKSILIRKSLSTWERILPDSVFLRIHRNAILNMNLIARVEKWFGNSFHAYLKDVEEPFVISRRYMTKLKSHI